MRSLRILPVAIACFTYSLFTSLLAPPQVAYVDVPFTFGVSVQNTGGAATSGTVTTVGSWPTPGAFAS